MSGTNFVFKNFLFEASRARSKCVFVKPTILTLVKLGQMTHLSTSNGKLLNAKLLGLINTYISYMDHIFIRINLTESEERVFKFEDGGLVKLGQTTEKMTWNGNLLNTKLLEFINIQTFYIDHFSIWKSLCKHNSPNLESHTNFMKLYVGSVDFELHFANTLSNAKMVYI